MSDQGLHSSQIDRDAAAWFARLKSRNVSNTTLRDFWAWHDGDGDHASAYKKVEGAWERAGHLADDPEIVAAAAQAAKASQTLPKPKLTWGPITPAGLGLGLATALVAAIGAGLWLAAAPPTYSTRVGQQRVVTLADGSRVRLNTDSRIRVRLQAHERHIDLLRGEAFFEVAHDPTRPFLVEAADANVRALGTRFDVRRDADGVWVALVEGRVNVTQDDRADAALLTPNQQLKVTAAGITPVRAADTATATSWTSGRLIFHDVALKDAVAQVNRYGRRQIELDPRLDRDALSGSFNTGDTDGFLAGVTEMFGLKTAPGEGDTIRLIPDPSRPAA